MRTLKIYCDHCGAEIDEMHDYPECEVTPSAYDDGVDLCKKCYTELQHIIDAYVTAADAPNPQNKN